MKLDLDFSVVSRFLGGIFGDLRQNRLWIAAVALLVALVAVPVLLSESSSPAPGPQASLPVGPPPAASSLPAIDVQTTPGHSKISGQARDPFNAASGASSSTSTTSSSTAASTAAAAVGSTASAATSGLASLSGGTGIGGGSTVGSGVSSLPSVPTTGNPPSITPNAHPTPAPGTLASDQSYEVSLTMSTANGGVSTTDPLERLSILPSQDEPRLVELGVLEGGNRVLFAVQPGTVLSGPGTCTPGPIDCEILSLGQDQTESVAAEGSTGSNVLFAVTGISVVSHGSATAANQARRSASAAGRALVDQSSSQALSLFQYDPSLGVVVDLRNLTTVGGS